MARRKKRDRRGRYTSGGGGGGYHYYGSSSRDDDDDSVDTSLPTGKPIVATLTPKSGNSVGLEAWSLLGARPVTVEHANSIELPNQFRDAFLIDPNMPKLGHDEYTAMVWLYIGVMENDDVKKHLKGASKADSGLEIAVGFFYDTEKADDGIQVYVPTQKISGGSVEIDWDKPMRHLMTGAEVDGMQSLGDTVVKIGTSHSHNTMGAFFSGTDDANELGQPGIHIVLGKFNKDKASNTWKYEVAPSIVAGQKRYELVIEADDMKVRRMNMLDVIAYDEDKPHQKPHADVWGVVEIEKYKAKKGYHSMSGGGIDDIDFDAFSWGSLQGVDLGVRESLLGHEHFKLVTCADCDNVTIDAHTMKCSYCDHDNTNKIMFLMHSAGVGHGDLDTTEEVPEIAEDNVENLVPAKAWSSKNKGHHGLNTTKILRDIERTISDQHGNLPMPIGDEYKVEAFIRCMHWGAGVHHPRARERFLKIIDAIANLWGLNVLSNEDLVAIADAGEKGKANE